MSDIPRYRPVANDKYGIIDDADGKLCEYRDYARLKAELARLRASSFVTAVPVEEYEKLKAEVERLENLVRYWSEKYQNENARFLRASERIAAKEGKPSV